jgi:hypothetical protein
VSDYFGRAVKHGRQVLPGDVRPVGNAGAGIRSAATL